MNTHMEEMEHAAAPGWYHINDGRVLYWDGRMWSAPAPGTAPIYQQQAAPFASGAVSGFVLGLLALLTMVIPLLSIPLGILSLVESGRALAKTALGTPGRGLATAGLVLAICAICITTVLILYAIPGAWDANFSED